MSKRRTELVLELIAALKQVPADGPDQATLLGCFYTADPRLEAKLAYLESYEADSGNPEEAGRVLEQVAFLAFGGIEGNPNRTSYRSATAQYDVLVHGDSTEWVTALTIVGLPLGRHDVLVECKAERRPLSDATLTRLAALIEGGLSTTIGLGVFFALRPPTGIHASQAKVTASGARLRQMLFMAQHNTPIVVLDLQDLRELTKSGTLLQILRNRIRELGELSARPPVQLGPPDPCDLPQHLRELLLHP